MLSRYSHLFGRATLSERHLQSFSLTAKQAPPSRERTLRSLNGKTRQLHTGYGGPQKRCWPRLKQPVRRRRRLTNHHRPGAALRNQRLLVFSVAEETASNGGWWRGAEMTGWTNKEGGGGKSGVVARVCWQERQQEGQWELTEANILIDGFLCRPGEWLSSRHSDVQQDLITKSVVPHKYELKPWPKIYSAEMENWCNDTKCLQPVIIILGRRRITCKIMFNIVSIVFKM